MLLNAVLHDEVERRPGLQFILVYSTTQQMEQGAQTIKHPNINHMSGQAALMRKWVGAGWLANTTIVFVSCDNIPRTVKDRIAFGAGEMWLVGHSV